MNELTVIHGNQQITLQPGQFAHIGRRNDNAVVINDPRVSREHIRVSWGPQGGWVLENLGQAVEAGPQGSTFVSPSSLPPDTATAPLGTSVASNWSAYTSNIASLS